jgi:hypothetical protein
MVLLAQLRQIGFVLHNSLPPIGFVSHDWPPREPGLGNWLCFARSARRAQGGKPQTFLNPQSDNSAEGGCRLPGAVPAIRNPQSKDWLCFTG